MARVRKLHKFIKQHPQKAEEILKSTLVDKEDLVRFGTSEFLPYLPLELRTELALKLTEDKRKATRISAARALLHTSPQLLSKPQKDQTAQALGEYKQTLLAIADTPGGLCNLALIAEAQGENKTAITHYKNALTIDDAFVGAYINLADVLRREKREQEAELTLRSGVRKAPKSSMLAYSLGLSLARQKKYTQARELFIKASSLDPSNQELQDALAAVTELTRQSKEFKAKKK